METNSVDALLNWLKVEPRTLGWGAIMAYARSDTNKVLRQEYIARFGKNNYLKPITEEIMDNTTPTQKEYLHNYQMDAPRLSFEGSNLQKSAAKLTMQVVGGTHLTFSKPQGNTQWSVTRVAQEDVLDGPQLLFDIDLMAATGSVSSAGRVELDISKGTNYRLTYVQTEHLRKVAGARMQQIFRPLPDDQKIFVLNELKFEPDQFLKPKNFVIRTHNKKGAGARLLANEDEGEGAVLVFVAMEGEANGTLPVDNKSLSYLIPDGKTATVLLKHEIIRDKVMGEGLIRINQSPSNPTYVSVMQGGNFFGISGNNGAIREPVGEMAVGDFVFLMSNVIVDFKWRYEGVESYFMFLTPGYNLAGGPIANFALALAGTQPNNFILKKFRGNEVFVKGLLDFTHDSVLPIELVVEKGEVIARPLPYKGGVFDVKPSSEFSSYSGMLEAVRSLMPVLTEKLKKCIGDAQVRFVSTFPVINVFILNSLLFRGENAVALDSVHIPRDMALFGQVGPTQTTFTINQLEPVVGHSETFQFTTEPARTDLTWKVENILDETVPVGSIGATTGLYTAPIATQLEGNFVRVRVTATAGAHTSSALVTVMRRGITINPLIQVATAGDPLALDVSAGTIDGGALTWSIEDPSSGAVIRPNPDGDHSYVPGPPQTKTPPQVDTIVVRNPRTGLAEKASVLVLHRMAILSVVIVDKPGLPVNQIQLAIMGEDGPIEPGDWDEEWQVLLGDGSAQIDVKTGLLTVNPAGPDKFLVITVLAPGVRGRPDDDGYIILPLPLFSVPETIQMLCADGQ